jgi:fibronectin-binding autotransporter adhesin
MIIDSPIISGSSAASGSLNQFGNVTITGSVNVSGSFTSTGTITAQTLVVQTITSSVVYSSGSNIFGNDLANTQVLTGSVSITGSLAVNGSNAVLSNQTSSMSVLSSSYALTASYVQASGVVGLNLSQIATGSITASVSLNSGSFSVTSGSSTFFFVSSSSRIGINTSTPLAQFHVGGGVVNNPQAILTNYPGDNNFRLVAFNANNSTNVNGNEVARFGMNYNLTAPNIGSGFYFYRGVGSTDGALGIVTNQTERIRVASTGFIGINKTTPTAQLDVSGSALITGSLNVSGGITGSLLGTASYATNALTSSYSLAGSGFPFSGSAVITGSLLVTNLSSSGVSYLVADAAGFVTAQTASAAIKSTQAVTSTAGQTSFNITNGYTTGLVDVYINGTKLSAVEYTDTSGTVITLATGSNNGDTVEFVKYFPASGVTNNVLRQQTTFTASAGQTVFSASYTPGLLDIYYNGSRLSTSDYTANSGTYFTLATASAASDILDVLVYSYQVGAFSGIGGAGVASQVAYFDTTNSITGSPNFTISGSTMTVTGSLIVSGSGTFTNIGPAVFSGSLTSTAGFTGSFSGTATSASYAANAELLDGLDSSVFTLTSSFAAQTASFTAFTSSINSFSASILAQTASLNAFSASVLTFTGSAATRLGALEAATSSLYSYTSSLNNKTASFATTGSNTFIGTQTISGSILQSGSFTTTGTIIAQTINVQTVTSSIIYSSGSNIFGNLLNNTQTFTGSVLITGSLTIAGASSATSYSGTTIYGSTAVCSAVGKFTSCIDAGSGTFSGALGGTSATFSSNISIGTTAASGGVLRLPYDNAIRWRNSSNTADLGFYLGGTNLFTFDAGISVAAAATFLSSVSIGGADQGYQLDVKRTSTGDSTFDTVANFYKASTHNTGLLLRLKNTIVDLAANNITGGGGPTAGMSFSVSSGGTICTALTISSTGIACFACELTAKTIGTNDLLLNNLNYECANYVDGTRGSWLIQEGACDLFIINQMSCKKYKFNLIEIK